MVSKKVKISNATGLHARPASNFVKTAMQFESAITISLNGNTVNAKSLLHILTLGANKGAEITIQAEGVDEEAAVDALVMLLNSMVE